MEIVYQTIKVKAFRQLPICAVFRFNKNIFIKASCTKAEEDDYEFNALNISKNCRHYFNENTIVEYMDSKLIVYGEPPEESED